MINIYQLFPRVFGNKTRQMQINGTIESNGCGKLNDINEAALFSLKQMGFTHIWLTGIIRHASLTDYSQYGIPSQHPALVKGRAGSPYAITDYYDIDPDLAENITQRMDEFEQLVKRIHKLGMKVIIDFVPNHLAREYRSVAKPKGVIDFGEQDDTALAFHPSNNFYYLPGQSFVPPKRELPIYEAASVYMEQPAKVTGNDCFHPAPGVNDWFETVKLNYGVDYNGLLSHHFEPVPDTWNKMHHILMYWLSKGVDGFRADMAEMIPVAFWQWLIKLLRQPYPDMLMIAEIYQSGLYRDFIKAGFDLLYDKVGLYNQLENILRHAHPAEAITNAWKQSEGMQPQMLRFMENHDEVRLASVHFAGNAFAALPAIVVSAFLHTSALMVYNGQETGEDAAGETGFSKDDGRTSIYDYCHMPRHQRWMNDGKFDGGQMLFEQHLLRDFYTQLLHMRLKQPALREGAFYDLMWANPWYSGFDPHFVYAFLRYTNEQRLLILVNFHRLEDRRIEVKIPQDAQKLMNLKSDSSRVWFVRDIWEEGAESIEFLIDELHTTGIRIDLKPVSYKVLEIRERVNNTIK